MWHYLASGSFATRKISAISNCDFSVSAGDLATEKFYIADGINYRVKKRSQLKVPIRREWKKQSA